MQAYPLFNRSVAEQADALLGHAHFTQVIVIDDDHLGHFKK